ncbi:hypothetical protein D3C86_395340 [compost metagenome]
MKKSLLILLIFFSIFQMCGDGYAYEKNKIKTQKSYCKIEIPSKIEKKIYCKKSCVSKTEYHFKCQHSTCSTISSIHLSTIKTIGIDFKNNTIPRLINSNKI